jgi:hypothetical protein
MRRLGIGVLFIVGIFAVPRAASAQAKQGDKEIKVGGNVFALMGSGGGTTTFGQFDYGVGFFVSDRFEVSVSPTLRVQANPVAGRPALPGTPALVLGGRVVVPATPDVPAVEPGTDWNIDSGFATQAEYFLGEKSSRVKPYVGGTFIIQSFKTDNGATFSDNMYSGGVFGLKSYLTPKAAFDFNGQYGFQTSHPGDFLLLQFTVGITYLF